MLIIKIKGDVIMNKKKEQDLQIIAKKLYNHINQDLEVFNLKEIDECKVKEYLVKMLKNDFINYD